MQDLIRKMDGVVSTRVGYSDGEQNPAASDRRLKPLGMGSSEAQPPDFF